MVPVTAAEGGCCEKKPNPPTSQLGTIVFSSFLVFYIVKQMNVLQSRSVGRPLSRLVTRGFVLAGQRVERLFPQPFVAFRKTSKQKAVALPHP